MRFGVSDKLDNLGRPLWIALATYDTKVGLAHNTHQITHHIDPEIDKERDKLLTDVERTGNLSAIDWIDGFQEKLSGKNGGGDPYRTDGRLAVGVLITRNRFGNAEAATAGGSPTDYRAETVAGDHSGRSRRLGGHPARTICSRQATTSSVVMLVVSMRWASPAATSGAVLAASSRALSRSRI